MAQDKMLKFLVEGLTRAFDKQEDCDVMFSVDGQTIGAHRLILNIHSQVLYEMAAGWTPDKDPIAIDDMSFDSFKALLRFMYSSEVSLTNDKVFIFLSASTQLKMNFLEELCADHLTKSMGVENVCIYMNEAVNFKSTILQEKCKEMFSQQTGEIAFKKSFKVLSQAALSALLDVGSTNLPEIELYRAVKQWMEEQCRNQDLLAYGLNMRKVIGDALYKIRFPTMTVQDFANSVATIEGLLTDAEEAQIFRKITVLDNKEITCSFSQIFRCQRNEYYVGFRDIGQLCKEKLLYQCGCQDAFDFGSMLKHVKDLPDGEDMFDPSFLVLLQCCADVANTSGIVNLSNSENQGTRNELCDDFCEWQNILKTENIGDVMTKFMEMRSKINKLYKW